MVYNATKCGLNKAVRAPNFGLPMVKTVARMLDPGSWFGDIDVGQMFLTFSLDRNISPYAGVNFNDTDNTKGTS
eukprot:15031602-Ditylum_brightwellii.AAC.1